MAEISPTRIKKEPTDVVEGGKEKPHIIIEIVPLEFAKNDEHADEENTYNRGKEVRPNSLQLRRSSEPMRQIKLEPLDHDSGYEGSSLPPFWNRTDISEVTQANMKAESIEHQGDIKIKQEPVDQAAPNPLTVVKTELTETERETIVASNINISQYIDHRRNTKKRLCEQKIQIDTSVKLLNRDTRPFVCLECGLNFIRNADLAVHFRTHTGEKPFQCTECGLKFTQKGNLTRHGRTHTGLKPYECNECGMKFAQKTLLKMHWRTHSGERPFQCSQCGQKFTTKSLVVTHFRKHTGERPFVCTECGRRFAQKHTLDCHFRIHLGVKPYECEICDRKFRFQNTYRRHVRAHESNKSFSCTTCGESFKMAAALKKHEEIHLEMSSSDEET